MNDKKVDTKVDFRHSRVKYLVFAVIGVTLITIGCMVFFAVRLNQQTAEEILKRYQREQGAGVSQQSARLAIMFEYIESELVALSKQPAIQSFSEETARPFLFDFYKRHEEFVVAGYLMNRKGILQLVEGMDRSGEGFDISDQTHVKKMFDTKQPVFSGSFKAVEGYYSIAMHAPIIIDGKVEGSTATLVKWNALGNWFRRTIMSPGSFTMLVDPKGKIIFHPDNKFIGKAIAELPPIIMDGKRLSDNYFFESNNIIASGPFFQNERFVIASHPFTIGSDSYTLANCAPYSDIAKPLTNLSHLSGTLAALGFLIAALSLSYISFLFHRDKKKWIVFEKQLKEEIADRKQAEEALKESKTFLRSLIQTIPDLVWLKDQQGKYLACNSRFEGFFGAKEKDIIGKTDYDFVSKEMADFFRKHDKAAMVKGRSGRNEETVVFADDGHSEILETIKTPMFRSNGELSGVLGIGRDITERKQAEEKKEALEARLQRAEKMEAIGTLAGGVAHDLNNVLSGLVSYPDLMLMDLPEDSPLRKPILVIQNSGNKAAAIVQDLLTLARRGVSTSEVTNVNEVIHEYFESPEYQKLKSFYPKVHIETHLEKDLLNILSSPLHLSKTVMNLVSNATEALSGGGTVNITTKNQYIEVPIIGYDEIKAGDYVVLTVSDDGIGIAASDLKRIFEPFYTKKVMGRSGTGLGMSVVWGTVKDHNGYISVESIEGKGATFKLYFPVTRKQAGKVASVTLETYMGKGEKVLVVDDMEEQRQIATMLLTKLGYSVDAVSSGEEAIEYMKSNSTDLLFLDMIMDPGIDGLDTYKNILELHPGQKAVIASGFTETDRAKEALQLGAGQYVKKPYTLEKVGLAVKAELCPR